MVSSGAPKVTGWETHNGHNDSTTDREFIRMSLCEHSILTFSKAALGFTCERV